MNLHKHRVIAIGAVISAMIVTAGCSAPATQPTSSGDTELDVVAPVEPTTLNPIQSTSALLRVSGAMFDFFVGVDDNGKPDDSGLVESWSRPDPMTWVFTLRDGVEFHDGSAFTAEDMVYTLTQIQTDPKAPYASFAKRMVSITAQDDLNVEMKTASPDNTVDAVLTTLAAVPSDYYEEVGADGFAAAPVGTGPFKYGSRQPGQSLTLERYDDYWGDVAKVGTVKFTYSAAPSARVALLTAGDADVVYDLPIDTLADLSEDKSLLVVQGGTPRTNDFYIRVTNGSVEMAELREAASLALDRDGIATSVYQGVAEPQTRYLTMPVQPETSAPSLPQNLDRAKQLVAAHKDAAKISLTYTTGAFPMDKAAGEAVATMLTSVGFEVTQNPMTDLRAAQQALIAPPSDPNGLHGFLQVDGLVFPHPDAIAGFYITGLGFCGNLDGYKQQSDEARATGSREEMASIYADMEARIVATDHCVSPLAEFYDVYGMSAKVKGFASPRVGSPDWTNISLD